MWQLKQTVSLHKVLIGMATLTQRHRQVNMKSLFTFERGNIENNKFRNVGKPKVTADKVIYYFI